MPRQGRRRSAARVVGALVVVSAAAGCSSDGPVTTTTTVSLATADCAASPPKLRVDLIEQAIASVEAQLGGTQQYFEINATDLLVNLFVAVDDATMVKPFVFLQGELNSTDSEPANGPTFTASSVDIDPQTITSCIAEQLPDSTLVRFQMFVGATGSITYSVTVESSRGGQLGVTVDGRGHILSV